MAPINDEDIDPALRSNDNNPSMQLFARPQPESNHNDATSEPGGEPDESRDDFQTRSPAFQDSQDDEESQETKAHNLIAFSKMILQRKKLSDKATSDFNIYCEAGTPFSLNPPFLNIIF